MLSCAVTKNTPPKKRGNFRKNYTGQKFWARWYHVLTVGRDEEVIRNNIRHQEEGDRRIDQLELY